MTTYGYKFSQGWHTLTPRIFARDTAQLVTFLKNVFLAKGDFLESKPTELKIGDSVITVSDAEPRGAYSACLYVYVSNLDETFNRAILAGATVVEVPLDTPYGDRRAVVTGMWGNMWQIAQYSPR